VCCVADSAAQFATWTAQCLEEGAASGQKLFRFGPQKSWEDEAETAAVRFVDPYVTVLHEGPLDPDAMFAMFRRETAAARREGYRGLRLVADMDWLLPASPSPAELTAFELLLDAVVAELDATVVCAYRRAHFGGEAVTEMVAVHPILVGGPTVDPGFRLWNVTPGVWEVTGELDAFNAEPFKRALSTAAEGHGALRLRAAALTFVAVAGLRAITQVMLAQPDLRLIIEDASVSLQECWRVLGLAGQLPTVEFRPGEDGR